ncbi:MAG: amino acid adenylation domain-containing protein [Betaproteobacteria bacterium]
MNAAAETQRGIHIVENSDEDRVLSYADLAVQSRAVLAGLQTAGVQPGDELVFQFADLRALILTYWACLAGRIVPVPLEFGDQTAATQKVMAVWRTLRSPWLATDGERLVEKFSAYAQDHGEETTWQAMRARRLQPLAAAGDPAAARLDRVQRDDIAFIQYSSGSTGTPKGVTLTHGNLLTNIDDILQSVDYESGDRFLTWKPITHDFGMIAFHLAPIVAAGDQVRINTDAFIWNPVLWFAMVHKYRAAILGSPNFGYRHFLKLFRRGRSAAADWDLSCVKVILNGAEPISEELCREFTDTLARYGLPRHAMTPGYGLAEGSLIVSLCPRTEAEVRAISVDRRKIALGKPLVERPADDPQAARFVDCGHPYPHTALRITDAKRRPLPEGHVGQIEIRGGAVTTGYFRNPQASRELITDDGWLNTQDLGVLRGGRLFVVGRVKEMIVVRGVNYFPHDIEQALLRAKGDNHLNKYVAVGAHDAERGSEALLVFVYHRRADGEFAPVAEDVRRIVRDAFGLPVAHVLPAAKIPKTTSGKVQRFKLLQAFLAGAYDEVLEGLGERREIGREPADARDEAAVPEACNAADGAAVLERVHAVVAGMLGRAQIDLDTSFFDLGLTSMRLEQFKLALKEDLGIELDASSPLDFPTVRRLAQRIAAHQTPQEAAPDAPKSAAAGSRAIALVAMACRFPGDADTPEALWQVLRTGIDPVREVPAERWQRDPQAGMPLTTRQGGFLRQVDQFDPLFFGISPAEAVALDPQQRLLLEVTHEAIENAGWSPQSLNGTRTGVIVAISGTEYAAVGRDLGHATGPYTYTGTMFNSAAGRIAYTWGLQGPCLAVDTACSSSLVAVQMGMRELRSGSCDQVIVGGVNLILRSDAHLSFTELNALAGSGRCRSFDEEADGYIRSEGCGVVVLKPLEDAERDGDPIVAVIEGGAVNHNGRSGGLTVPSGPAQERLIRAALANAGVAADAVDYVEAHGSGTRLGDPQELTALAHVFGERSQPLRLGSVKSNLGHLESAAGMAGLIKVALMLQHRQWVPTLHFRAGNSLIDWAAVPLSVVTVSQPWPAAQDHVRRAGVSSFGISGTNAHVVLREYRARRTATAAPVPHAQVFTLSARSGEGLATTLRAWVGCGALEETDFAALCQTVNRSRSEHPWRFACVADSSADVRRQIEQAMHSGEEAVAPVSATPVGPVVFLFTGQGSIYPQVARRLYQESTVFRRAFDRCAQLFAPHLPDPLQACAFDGDSRTLAAASVSQALIFAVEHALAALWKSWKVQPQIVLGHSIGEYAAACEAGVIGLEDAVAMVALRARLVDAAPADGAMVGLLADEAAVRQIIAGCADVHIAAVNTDENCTVSAPVQRMAQLTAAARKARIFPETLPVSHAFHSPQMADVASRLVQGLAGVRFEAPRLTYISAQRAAVMERAEQLGPAYWGAHLCEPVRFRDAMQLALSLGGSTFVEIGGTAALSGLAAQIGRDERLAFLPSLREGRDDWSQINQSLATLYRRGQHVDWQAYHEGRRGFVAGLPNTGYQRSVHWFADLAGSDSAAAAPRRSAAPARPQEAVVAAVRAAPALQAGADLQDRVTHELRAMIGRVTGIAQDQITPDANLFELGIDSLMLMQIDKRVVKRFGVNVPVKQFFAELTTPGKIADYLCTRMPAPVRAGLLPAPGAAASNEGHDERAADAAADMRTIPAATAALPPAAAGLEGLITAQLEIMRQQLALLRGDPPAAATPAVTGAAPAAAPRPAAPATQGRNTLRDMALYEEDVTPQQRAFIRDLVERVVARTPGSKAYAQRHRRFFADWIATLNYSLTLKEMAYPVVAARSHGSRFWDIDGNEYIDTAMGYGATLFGHNPDFIVEALRVQLDEGMILGPQSGAAGEVAERICRLIGQERAAFCNSGTEAVMMAVRLARAGTRRPKIVRFINSYHGSFDGVLAEAGEDGATPVAPGIVDSMIADTVVLPYGSPQALQSIRALGPQLAGVLVEPVQSRAPRNHSREYLQALRDVCTEIGAALIFDEMITGFRVHPGGVQAHYGVRADIATYGKVVGGGMPIGVVAGSARFMDAIDGGFWQFGDASGPMHETTFFAGTFCKHPLAMAAARAVLRRLEAEGEALLGRINNLTQRFCDRANAYFDAEEVPIEAQCFGSLYRFETKLSQDPARSALEMNLLFRLMMLEGVFVWERRTSFFSEAHTEADADRILEAVRRGVAALRAGGFVLRSARAARPVPALLAAGPGMLSSEERRMYVLSLMKGGEYAYHVTGALRLRGQCDVTRVARALNVLAGRHAMLRASYGVVEGQVQRRVADRIKLPLQTLAQNGRELGAVLADVIQPFDLTRAPLWRAALIRPDAPQGQEWVLALDFHHLIADGVSMSVLIEEFIQLCRGAALEPVGEDYSAFVRWEQTYRASAEATQQRDYWLRTLSPVPASLALPADFPRPPRNDFAGASLRFELGLHVLQRVRAAARAHQSTPFMVLLAAYFALLRKLTQQSDLCVGTPFDRRGNGDFDRTVGMFAQTLVVRTAVEETLSFSQMLAAVRSACMDAYAHPNCALDEIVNGLGLARDFSRNPLFDTLFIYENGNRRVVDGQMLSVDTLPVPSKGSAFDLTLEITEQQEVLHGHFVYARRLFQADTVQRWAQHFEHLLLQLLAAPQTPMAELSLLDAADRARLIEGNNRTALAHDRSDTVVSCWRAAVARTPRHPALVFGERVLSYEALDAFSDDVARHLHAAGVRRSDRVGILLPRGVSLIAAMLAVLKAGAAYVPLDPEYPPKRVDYMLRKGGIEVLLTTDGLASRMGFAGHVLDPETLAQPGPQTAIEEAQPRDLAYVIFTSGSTGEPKGVMLEHASVVNFLRGMEQALAWPAKPVVLGLTTISFDIFVLEVFSCFVAGGTLVLADEAAQRDPAALAALLRARRINVMQATPSRLQALLATHMPAEVLGGLQMLLVGGEAFPRALLAPLQALPGLRIYNMYGPTETTVWSCVKDLTRAGEVTLGRPIANTRVYVLDERLQPVPVGATGDLWIAGEGLARGYLDDSEKTAAGFVPDPFHPNERMYRSGDRAAWTAAGELIYQGRGDSQVKLRGYRIEMQEIEAVLQRHPSVALAAVAVQDLAPGNPVLVACCVARAGAAADEVAFAVELRAHAARELPAYMVPAMVLRVPELPRTPNGKIDRRNLPQARPPEVAAPPWAHDGIEAEVVQIWQRLLGERPIGLHDSFFDVGGNSFSLVSMHAALNEKYPGVLEVADLFANPTVAALKVRIAAGQGAQSMPQALSLPAQWLNTAGTPLASPTVHMALDAAVTRGFGAMAASLDAEPYELAVTIFTLYLNKLAGEPSFEVAVGFRERPEYVLLQLDFGAQSGLRQLVASVCNQHRSHKWVARRLVERDSAPQDDGRIRPLLLRASSAGSRSRYGFDLVLRLNAGAQHLGVQADYDGSRMLPTAMQAFVGNYLRLVKVLAGAGAAEPSLE